ncbi:SDR family NAD(P)-dependent oxidoreductase [Umezawaea endophytica]|uniref:SDR family oxidoreductase n=1 Tax=Umezawaea endophytica TaxID=1654476 RepID=A0A9X2VX07_9PSEU|nr:SDR family oxidoreductase [Umezawaea endophytica]MCS7483233.1 SDR family oxidoreductase [Umezawaea endophytica]
MSQLAGKVALVTGGSRGIGAAIALRLARDGADVALTYVAAKDRADQVVERIEATGRKAVALRADMADAEEVAALPSRAVAELGGLDVLVNNAGTFSYGPIQDVPLAEVDRMIAIHVRGTYLATQAALPHLGRGGRVISIGSCWGVRVPVPNVALYSMTKSALIGFTKGLAHDLGPLGITVNTVDPGPTATEMNGRALAGEPGEDVRTATGTYGAVEDIASAVAFLAGPEARWITGTALAVDGGYTA